MRTEGSDEEEDKHATWCVMKRTMIFHGSFSKGKLQS
jgi:hypothetical protein